MLLRVRVRTIIETNINTVTRSADTGIQKVFEIHTQVTQWGVRSGSWFWGELVLSLDPSSTLRSIDGSDPYF